MKVAFYLSKLNQKNLKNLQIQNVLEIEVNLYFLMMLMYMKIYQTQNYLANICHLRLTLDILLQIIWPSTKTKAEI